MHKDDEKWVTEQIRQLPTYEMRQTAMDGYKKVFAKYYENEPLEHRKDGTARRAANIALRKYIDKCKF